ncbi:spermatogenesis-associated protein 48-like [Gigantopelta aegis]|uniref:spermatogenesis-associated protein 48-like n=1 Tax=Gigantopelta aegis TaxID=1735272 RepID=UPI001B88A581|nr:spermatogenesis-associated protein 48-like [Gigantopelta aegis]
MEAVASKNHVLSDSNLKSRPEFRTYLTTDASAGGDVVTQIKEKRRRRHQNFPCLRGRADVDSFQEKVNENPSFKKWNDEGNYRAPAPYRSFDNIVDPVSGFVSVGGDMDRNTGHTMMRSFVLLSDTPQSAAPRDRHSNRTNEPAAPMELRRATTTGGPSQWNSRKVPDASIRAKLGGWTSDHDPRKPVSQPLGLRRSKSMYAGPQSSELSKSSKDLLALKYMYSSSTQRGYEEVQWDNMLGPKVWPPVSTLEDKADPVSQRWNLKRYHPAAQEWQAMGRGWDWFQTRHGYYGNRPVVFCNPLPRTPHIPGYSGCVGAENLEEMDNIQEEFTPFTVKRATVPRPTDTAHRPNIPCYTGCSLWQGAYNSNNSHHAAEAVPSTADVHRTHPVSPNESSFKRGSRMSKMVTLVPPCNPFNSVEKETIVVS